MYHKDLANHCHSSQKNEEIRSRNLKNTQKDSTSRLEGLKSLKTGEVVSGQPRTNKDLDDISMEQANAIFRELNLSDERDLFRARQKLSKEIGAQGTIYS